VRSQAWKSDVVGIASAKEQHGGVAMEASQAQREQRRQSHERRGCGQHLLERRGCGHHLRERAGSARVGGHGGSHHIGTDKQRVRRPYASKAVAAVTGEERRGQGRSLLMTRGPLGVSFPTLPTCTSIKEKTWDGPNPLSKQELGSSHPKNRVRSNPSLLVLEPNTC
jgi:hypothetical protein